MSGGSKAREKIIALTKRKLSGEYPRVQISFILLATAFSGFFASVFFLKIGVISMAIRYFLAVCLSYVIFLFILRIWLWLQKREREDLDIDVNLEGVDLSGISLASQSDVSTEADFEFRGGGDFSGAGVGGSWTEGDPTPKSFGIVSATNAQTSGSGGSSIPDLGDGDDLIWIILVVVALAVALIAVFYVIYIAPALLAEILVDGVLVTGIYRRVRKLERKLWLTTAIKKTILPAIIIALCFGIAGFAMQQSAPEARSIGDFLINVLDE